MKKTLAVLGAPPRFPDKLYVTRPVVPKMGELTPLLEDILASRWLTNDGKYAREFESQLSKFLDVPNCAVFCNGTLALQLSVQALRLSGEVITTPFTFAATPHILYWNNITPVFCDLDPQTYNIDTQMLETLITPRTTGILPVHIFGNPCEVEKIGKIADYHGLKVVYDAAHAFGVESKGKNIGNYGHASMFSFHATKLFTTLEGGAVSCADPSLYQRLRDFRNFGIRSEEEVIGPGINAKMNEFQAAFGLLNLKKVAATIQKRKLLYERYKSQLSKLKGLHFQKIMPQTKYNYAYFTVRVVAEEFGLDRDQVYLGMRREGIMVRKYFWPLSSNYSCYKALPSAGKNLLPHANSLSEQILALPLYEDLGEEKVDQIAEVFSLLQDNAPSVKKELAARQ